MTPTSGSMFSSLLSSSDSIQRVCISKRKQKTTSMQHVSLCFRKKSTSVCGKKVTFIYYLYFLYFATSAQWWHTAGDCLILILFYVTCVFPCELPGFMMHFLFEESCNAMQKKKKNLLSSIDANNAFMHRGCKGCGRDEIERGCNGEGRIQGGIAAVPGFGWWPIKAYRPCPGFVSSGGRYQRQGQSMDDVASERERKSLPAKRRGEM